MQFGFLGILGNEPLATRFNFAYKSEDFPTLNFECNCQNKQQHIVYSRLNFFSPNNVTFSTLFFYLKGSAPGSKTAIFVYLFIYVFVKNVSCVSLDTTAVVIQSLESDFLVLGRRKSYLKHNEYLS